MSTEDPTKSRFTCPTCSNNVSATPEEFLEPVTCPHCGQTGMFTPAKPKPEPPADSDESADIATLDAAADALAASEFSDDSAGESPPAAHKRKAAPRRKQKQTAAPTPPRRAGDASARKERPGYRRHDARPAAPPKEGFSLLTVFLVIVAVALSVIIIMIMMPKSLKFIAGYPAGNLGGQQPKNLLADVQEILGPRDRAIAFSEAEVNAYLNHRIKGRQRGPMTAIVKYKGVYADFEKNLAEFYIERSVIGIPFTMSLKLTKSKLDHKTTWRAGGGSIGKFRLSSRQFKPIIDAFVRLGMACEEEMDAVKMMGDVRFEDDRVILDPTFGGRLSPSPRSEPPPKTEPAPETKPAAEPGSEPGTMDEKMEGDTSAMEPEPDASL